jgi:glycosyltransferase involved in cell wall biosynthesis
MISTIVLAHGDSELLSTTIRQAIRGTHPHWELLVVGKIGDLPTWLDLGHDADRVIWIDLPDVGPVEAVSIGLARARGGIISVLAAGDFHFEDTLHIVAETAERHPRVAGFYGDAMIVDAAGRSVAEFNTQAESRRNGRRHCRFCPAAVFIRRDAIERAGGLDLNLRHWADYDLWLRLERAGATFEQIPRLLAARRTGTQSPPPSDFTTIPTRVSLDELMQVRLDHGGRPLSPSRLAWYGALRATLTGSPAAAFAARIEAAFEHALAAHRRWGDGRPLAWHRRAVLAATLAVRMARGDHRKEFTVRPATPLVVKRFQAMRRKIFRLAHHAPLPLRVPQAYARTPIPDPAPVISLVTPSFNQGCVLEDTLRSVLDQGYPALEYIVQDGGSTDGSVAILERYSSQLTAWESGHDGGQAAAINRGLRRTSGEIMAYLNSDDILLPGTLAYVAGYFQQHPDVDVVYGHRVLIDDGGREIGRWILPSHDDRTIAFADFIPQETMFWRRRAWDTVGAGIDESFRFAMDWDLILRFRDAGLTFRRLPRFLGGFRVWQDQKSVSWWLPFGRRETERLMARTLGDAPTREGVRDAIRWYVYRHWLLDKLYLAGLVRY